MEGFSLQCTWVTPAAWGGAFPRKQVELRTASLKGLLRYWWRILYQGCHPHTAPRNLFAEEAARFGGPQNASPLSLRITPAPALESLSLHELHNQRFSYFLFPFRNRDQGRQAWKQGGSWGVEVCLRPGAQLKPSLTPQQLLEEAYMSFWLMAHLGGIGTRSRRGFGSFTFRVSSPNASSFTPRPIPAETPEAYAQALQKALSILRASFCSARQENDKPNESSSLPPLPCLHPDTTTIAVWQESYKSWQDALKAIQESYSQHRRAHPPALKHTRVGFGLPIQGYEVSREKERLHRRASPLWLRVVPLKENRYTVQATFFRAQLLPTDTKLRLRSTSRGRAISAPSEPYNELYQKEALDYAQKWLNSQKWHIVAYA